MPYGDYVLAEVNVARLIAPIDDARIAGFVQMLDPVNRLADASAGFVWRLQSSTGNATDIVFADDPRLIVHLSVWESPQALRDFTYASGHLGVFKQRGDWFEKMEQPHYCLWWIPSGSLPTVADAKRRLAHYQTHGPTPYAFWFSHLYPAPSEQLAPA
jgi:Domain of unknown function (DUF3291)